MKMFHPAERGRGPSFWDATWNDGLLDTAIRFCEVDPLRPLFERYAPAGTHVLEGGCGRGQYVVFLEGRGAHVVGLDFAQHALRRLKSYGPRLRVCRGDVATLPFASEAFDVYYSGGVVEHFEDGPLPALREAHRVLRRDGVLLVSVPYLSPLRRLSRLWRSDRVFVRGTSADGCVNPRHGFWQYAFGRQEFTRLLSEAGFQVRSVFPYALLFGLCDFPLLAGFLSRLPGSPSATAPMPAAPSSSTLSPQANASPRWRAVLKRLLVSEDRNVPVVGRLLSPAGFMFSNMMMYVAVK
jgi:SAM-dependent methyltransferase